jgi:hypothetical protein
MILDVFSGIVNIIAFTSIGNSSAESIHEESKKVYLDYYMIIILVVSWVRFFSYFLVIAPIAKLTITLMVMIRETTYFFLIFMCYLLIMITIFTSLFRNSNSSDATPY